MSGWKKLASAAAASGGVTNVEDVFSTYLYEGTGTSNSSTQNITNNIDLSTEGGLVWIRDRAVKDHFWFDTERGATKYIRSNNTDAESSPAEDDLSAFLTDGFTVRGDNNTNQNGQDYVSWTFRKAPKFFDVVTYTGDGANSRTISHNLNSNVGMVIIKRTDSTSAWAVWHRSLTQSGGTNGGAYNLALNQTDAQFGTSYINSTTSSNFTVGAGVGFFNTSGATYVAYLFAHNDSDGEFGPNADQDIIKCGSYTGTGTESISNFIDVGFEPQFIIVKRATGGSEDWIMGDTQRGFRSSLYTNTNGHFRPLQPNSATAEYNDSLFWLQNNGFSLVNNSSQVNANGSKYIYIAIRQGNMGIPENASDVFDLGTNTSLGTNAFFDGTPSDIADMVITTSTNVQTSRVLSTRFTGGDMFLSANSSEERFGASYTHQWGDVKLKNKEFSGNPNTVAYSWKRATGYFDIVQYVGDGTSGREISHNLGVVPEMMWVKSRTSNDNWNVLNPNDRLILLNQYGAEYSAAVTDGFFGDGTSVIPPTDTKFTVGSSAAINDSNQYYLAYLFASVSGVSKIGTFTGTGSAQTIDCGFSSGARFVMIKHTQDANTYWHIWDSERGIVAGDDPFFIIAPTNTQTTNTDIIDPTNSGFIVNYNASWNINTSGDNYMFYAIA